MFPGCAPAWPLVVTGRRGHLRYTPGGVGWGEGGGVKRLMYFLDWLVRSKKVTAPHSAKYPQHGACNIVLFHMLYITSYILQVACYILQVTCYMLYLIIVQLEPKLNSGPPYKPWRLIF